MKDFFYKIQGFCPPDEIGRMSGFGFGVMIDKELVDFALQKRITKRQYDFMQSDAESIIRGVGLANSNESIRKSCFFVSTKNKKNLSCFMQYCTVPGNACHLGLDGMKVYSLQKDRESYSNFVEYTSHNVDTHTQAYALLSIWINWADMINAIYSLDNF